jgi:outer membrane protein assembly factor BamA
MAITQKLLCLWGVVVVVLASTPAWSQDTTRVVQKNRFTPMVFPGYSPELGFNVGGGALWSFRTNTRQEDLLTSSVPLGITYGFTGAVSLKANWVTFWNHNRLRINSDWYLRDMNDHYFGVGYDNGSTVPKSDTTTAYRRMWWQFDTRVLFLIEPNMFAGFRVDLNKTTVKETNPLMEQDPYYLEYGPRNYNSGVGFLLQYDSRDFPQNAFSGLVFSMSVMVYGKVLGGTNSYTNVEMDVRKYWQLHPEKQRILAGWFRFDLAGGRVPYGELPQAGPNDLRGYYWGQYRDKSFGFALLEYRHKFYRASGKASRSGFVVWYGMGYLASEFGNVEARDPLPNVGWGYRFELQPRLNVRADFGYGFNSSLFYLGFTEQF